MLESTEYAVIKLLGFVKAFYNTPRFGQSKDISHFFSDVNSIRNGYYTGLLLVFMLLMTIAAIWFITLIVLRLLGRKAGCASGNAATIPAESMMAKGSYSVHTDETGEFIVMQADQNRVNRTRLAYLISVILTLGGCGVLVYGLLLLMRSLTSLHDSAEQILNHVSAANIDNFMTSAGEFATSKEELVTSLSGFCNGAGADVNGLNPATVASAFETSLSGVDDLTTNSTWTAIDVDLTDIETLLQRMVNFLGRVDGPSTLWFIVEMAWVGIMVFFCLYLLFCAWKSGKEGYQFVGEDRPTCYTNFLNYIATPLFAVFLAFAWFNASALFTSHVANADYCYGEIVTGKTILNILVENGYAETTDAYHMADEFLHGCESTTTSPISAINDFEKTLDEVSTAATNFQGLTPSGDASQLKLVCGEAATNDLITKSDATITLLDTFKSQMEDLQGSVSCETMAPLMQGAAYENACNSLSKGLFWSFVSGLCVATFGTIMLSLRSATLRPQIFIIAGNPASRDLDEESSFG